MTAWRPTSSTSASRGGRIANFGILRPGALCLIHLPADLGALHLAAQVLWCTILGAE